jgi:hypothetical protein
LQTFGTIESPADTGFDWLFNQNSLDGYFDQAVAELSRVDEELWK